MMKRLLQVIKSVLCVIGLLAVGILTGALLTKKLKLENTDEAEKAKEDKKNEIESTPADVLVASSDNANELGAIKDGIKSDFRERIRNRLESELHRLGSGSPATDSDGGIGTGD